MENLLEYLVRLQGTEVAAAEIKGLRDQFAELGAAAKEAGDASDVSAGSSAAARDSHIGASGAFAGMAKMSKVGILGLAGFALAGVKSFTSFQSEMLKIQTEAGGTSKQVKMVTAAAIQLGKSGAFLNQGPQSIAQGLYQLESMNIRGKSAILGVKLAANEAAISGANMEQTVKSLGGAVFIAAKGTGGLVGTMGALNAIAGAGAMRFQDLNEALGTGVLGSAKTAGISLQSVGAALAVLTDSGYPASSAAAQLGTSLHYLYEPTTKAAKALATIGLSGNQLAMDLRKPNGIFVALADLRKHMKGLSSLQQEDLLGDIFPGGRGRVLTNLYQLQYRGGAKYSQIMGTEHDFAAHEMQQHLNPGTKLATALGKVEWNLVSLGQALQKYVLPVATAFVAALGHMLTYLTAVVGWFVKMGAGAKALTTFLGVLAAAFVAYKAAVIAATVVQAIFTAAGTLAAFVSLIGDITSLRDIWVLLDMAMDANPLAIVIVAMAALAAGVVYAYTKFSWFRAIVKSVWSWLKTAATDTVKWVINAFGNMITFFEKLPGRVGGFFASMFGKVLGFLKSIPKEIAKIGTSIWDGLKSGMVAAINWIIGKLNDLIKGFNDVVGKIPFVGKHLKIGTIGLIKTGGGTSGSGLTSPKASGMLPGSASASASSKAFLDPFAPIASGSKHAPWAHGDIVVKVGADSIARVTRREMQKAMMG